MCSSADTGAYPEVFHVLFSLASWLHPAEKKINPVLEIPCGQQEPTFVLCKPAVGFPFSGNSLFWKTSAMAGRLIYVTNRNQTVIKTFHKHRMAPGALVWRWLMLPSLYPTAPSLCEWPRGMRRGCDGMLCMGFVTMLGWYPTWGPSFGAIACELIPNVTCFWGSKEV